MDRAKITRDEAGTYWLQSATDRKDVIACIQSRDPRMDAFVRAVDSHAALIRLARELASAPDAESTVAQAYRFSHLRDMARKAVALAEGGAA